MNETLAVVLAIILSLLLLPFFVISYLRVAGPHSRKMAREQAEVDKKNNRATSEAPVASTASGGRRLERLTPYWPSILIVVVGAAAVYWGFQNTQIRPTDAGSWGQKSWLPLLIIWGIFIALVEVNGWPKGLHWVTSGVVVLLFIVLPFIGRVNEPPKPVRSAATLPSPEACTKSRPCAPLQQADGSTEEVLTPVGKSLCFDDSFFANVSRLGYATSYQGGTEMSPGCTTVSCKMDSFRFTPQPGVGVPKYWFVREGASRC